MFTDIFTYFRMFYFRYIFLDNSLWFQRRSGFEALTNRNPAVMYVYICVWVLLLLLRRRRQAAVLTR
jgi:hypothetical protein